MKKTLQALFDQPIVSVKTLGEQYDGRANDVWLISFQDQTEYVIKSPKTAREESEFVYGINMIYGVNAHKVQAHLDQINEKLTSPDSASLILIDLDPSQYIEKDDQVTSLVDTEYVVFGPTAFDFIALEYLLTKEAAHDVQLGYEEICPIPHQLHEVRECYRFVSLLLDIHGSWDLNKWMNHPILFYPRR